MNYIDILDRNHIPHREQDGRIIIQCPFCDKPGMATFSIDPNGGRGECGECNRVVGQETWLEKLGIQSSTEPQKSHRASRQGKRKDEGDADPKPKPVPPDRVIKVEKPANEVSFDIWMDTIKANFPTLAFPAEVAASVLAQILITDIANPFALVFVDAPSSGKTMTINLFADIDGKGINGITYPTDRFTPASFVSNATNVKKEELDNIDLLPRIRYKMFLIRDLAVIFSKSEDGLNENLGTLTRVLDGQGFNTDSGAHGQRHLSGDYLFMMLAASTPIKSHVWKVMGSIGSRLFFLNMHAAEKTEAELANQITSSSTKNKERVCREMTRNFVQTLWFNHRNGIEWNMDGDKMEYKLIIGRCANLLSKLRGITNAWEKKINNDEQMLDYDPPVIEYADRINQLLYNLCRGHAVICGRTQISAEDLHLAIELTFDSAHILRVKLLRGLLDHGGAMKTQEVERCLDCSKPTALKYMEILRILRIAKVTPVSNNEVGEPEFEIRLSDDLAWFLTNECRTIRGLPPIPPALGDIPS
jgi:hypothetical protein